MVIVVAVVIAAVVAMFVTMLFVPFDARPRTVIPVMLVGMDVVATIDPDAIPRRVVDDDTVSTPGKAH
jgi:hypothetical protein